MTTTESIAMSTMCVACDTIYGRHIGDSCPNGTTTFVAAPTPIAVEDDETPTETVTFRDFFESLNKWQHFAMHEGSDPERNYIFAGFDSAANEFIYFDMFWTDKYTVKAEQFDHTCDWIATKDDAGEPITASRTVRMAIDTSMYWRNTSIGYEKRIDELETAYQTAVSDLKTVNQKINEYADETSMCNDYERRIFSWNDELTFKLQGRPKNWSVPIHFPDFDYDARISVSATNPEAAKEMVKAMSKETILRQLLDQGYEFRDMDINISEDEEPYC